MSGAAGSAAADADDADSWTQRICLAASLNVCRVSRQQGRHQGRRSWGLGGPDPLKICRRGQSVFWPPEKSHSFIQNCCCITASFTTSRMNTWTLSLRWSCLCWRCCHPYVWSVPSRQCSPINAFVAPLGLSYHGPRQLQYVGTGDPSSTILIDHSSQCCSPHDWSSTARVAHQGRTSWGLGGSDPLKYVGRVRVCFDPTHKMSHSFIRHGVDMSTALLPEGFLELMQIRWVFLRGGGRRSVKNGASLPTSVDVQRPESFPFQGAWPWPGTPEPLWCLCLQTPYRGSASCPPHIFIPGDVPGRPRHEAADESRRTCGVGQTPPTTRMCLYSRQLNDRWLTVRQAGRRMYTPRQGSPWRHRRRGGEGGVNPRLPVNCWVCPAVSVEPITHLQKLNNDNDDNDHQRIALRRAHTSAVAADTAKLSLLNKQRMKHTTRGGCRNARTGGGQWRGHGR